MFFIFLTLLKRHESQTVLCFFIVVRLDLLHEIFSIVFFFLRHRFYIILCIVAIVYGSPLLKKTYSIQTQNLLYDRWCMNAISVNKNSLMSWLTWLFLTYRWHFYNKIRSNLQRQDLKGI